MESLSNVVTHPYLSICTGIGGLELGVHEGSSGSAIPACYIEREITSSAVLSWRMETKELSEAPIWSDIKTFDAEPFRNKVCGIVGGYPCQPFSQASPPHYARKGIEDERNLWFDIKRIIEQADLRWCFFENVDGHLQLGYYDQVKPGLESLGFRVKEQIIQASSVGAPHQRRRLFILAYTDCYPLASLPETPRTHNYSTKTGFERSDNIMAKCGCVDGGRCDRANRAWSSASSTDSLFKLSRSELGQFPPTRDGCWSDIPVKYWPSFEREFHRMDDGISRPLDFPWRERARQLGNAVIPKQAAMAWYLLWKEVYDELDREEQGESLCLSDKESSETSVYS